jgi:MYXO-CTERM domain-containing protein
MASAREEMNMATSHGMKSLVGVLAGSVLLTQAFQAQACGGFFCSQAQPVNQAAERIIFGDNGDGTVTAVIQILYEGPSENFSWLLPISTVPQDDQIAVASNLAFQRLQQATNPQYNLTTRVEGNCRSSPPAQGSVQNDASPLPAATGVADNGAPGSGVVVAASGIVGAFEWTVLELDPELAEPADAALNWLTEHGYDVTPGAETLIGPYLEEGMYLLALRLTKGSSSGSIRPIVLTYDARLPMIPIKLTAVAANDDMGVMTWVSSGARAVPFNYNALELNEARINWFNASSNYESVVTAAANEGGGQGFVTEFAGPSASLQNVVWPDFEEQQWQAFKTYRYSSFEQIFEESYYQFGQYDGFWDAARASVTLPDDVAFEDFQLCPTCYDVELAPSVYIQALEDNVIKPMRDVQALLDRQPYLTRFYSTLSAAEMTADPVFAYNPDLGDVSNLHSAERIIECNPRIDISAANWRIELPQGGVIRGTPRDVGTWPSAASDQPANFRVLKLATAGLGEVLKDNSSEIGSQLDAYNDSQTTASPGSVTPPGGVANPGTNTGVVVNGGDSGGCSVASAHRAGSSDTAWAALGLLLALGVRRRPTG